MCGISGIISTKNTSLVQQLNSMVATQRHRGPDGQGTHFDKLDSFYNIGLGHNRLAILDLSEHSKQPMVSQDGNFALSYNGEIYNFQELATELGLVHNYNSVRGDTEVVFEALRRWGPEAFSRFNGMWAILFYDRLSHTLLVSRDRLGIKPLYVCKHDDNVYFASEIKAILKATNHKFRLNPNVAVPYLTRGLLDIGSETFFQGITAFQAGTYQLIDLKKVDMPDPTPFWLHPFKSGTLETTKNSSSVKEVFLDSVKIQLRSDVPIAVLLSGGIDSSAITGAATKYLGMGNVATLSVVSDEPDCDESRFISVMAKHVMINPILVSVSTNPLSMLEMIPEATWSNDQPLCGLSDVAHLLLMQQAKKLGFKVLLSGQGADEEFGGYNKFFYFYIQDLLKQGHYFLAIKIILASACRTNTLWEFRWSEALRYLNPAKLEKMTFIRPEVESAGSVNAGLGNSYQERECKDLLELSLPQLLHFEDRLSMSQSIEVRVPFLDHRLVELAATISPNDKFRGGWSKSIIRDAIAEIVPPSIRFRKDKKGFTIPEAKWMRNEFVRPYQNMLAKPMLAHTFGIIDQEKATSQYASFLKGKGFLNARHFFRLYLFESFLRRFEDFILPVNIKT